mgnify:CR=1 FL=1
MRPYVFAGGSHVGMLCLLASVAHGYRPRAVVHADIGVKRTAEDLGLLTLPSTRQLKGWDAHGLLLSVHLREIVKPDVLRLFYHAINLHPCLPKYPGPDPIQRLLAAGDKEANVAAHRMEELVDAGEIVEQLSLELPDSPMTPADVYLWLYPLYVDVALRVLRSFLG